MMENSQLTVNVHPNQIASDKMDPPMQLSSELELPGSKAKEDESQKQKEKKLEVTFRRQEKALLALRRTQIYLQPTLKDQVPARFVSIDIEAFEFNQNWITEVGISTLDTSALVGLEPGPLGKDWAPYIDAKHFRVIEHEAHVNKVHVDGCPDDFDFGVSEWIYEREIGTVISKAIDALPSNSLSARATPCVVLVGHNVQSDIKYMASLGVDIKSKVADCIDTDELFKASHRQMKSSSLSKLLTQYEIPSKHMHNGGNDAFYTLCLLLAIAVDDLANPITDTEWEERKQEKIRIACEEATNKVKKEFEGWSGAADSIAGIFTVQELMAKATRNESLIDSLSSKEFRSRRGGDASSAANSRGSNTSRPRSTSSQPSSGRASQHTQLYRGEANVRRGRGNYSSSRGERGSQRGQRWIGADYGSYRGGGYTPGRYSRPYQNNYFRG